jgi:hypothetical protein
MPWAFSMNQYLKQNFDRHFKRYDFLKIHIHYINMYKFILYHPLKTTVASRRSL